MADAEQTPLRYRGQNNIYVDIANRGTDESLGFSVDYGKHPTNGAGYLVVRFVVHGSGVDPKNYKHLMYREGKAQFLLPATATKSAEVFFGVRLNKIAIKVFEPAVSRYELRDFLALHGLFGKLTEWVTAQVVAEGFTLIVDLESEIYQMLTVPPTPSESVTCVAVFPDLTSPEEQWTALQQVVKPEPEPDEDDEDDDKPWVN